MESVKNSRLVTAALVVGSIIGTYVIINWVYRAKTIVGSPNQRALEAEAQRLEMEQEPYYIDLD
jgi:hypothetical protein